MELKHRSAGHSIAVIAQASTLVLSGNLLTRNHCVGAGSTALLRCMSLNQEDMPGLAFSVSQLDAVAASRPPAQR